MQGGRDPFSGFGDPFAGFGGFGGFGGPRSLMSSFFGGRDPFDDPFFTRPFGGLFESNFFGPSGNPFVNAHPSGFLERQPSQAPSSRSGPIIEELNSDDEKESESEIRENPRKHGRSSQEPYVEHPDDEAEETSSKLMHFQSDLNRRREMASQPRGHSYSFQSTTVSYGGANGTYYSSSKMRRTGSDGLTFEESKEANSATGEAKHGVLRGIHNKGHSMLRKLNSDGRVDTMQTLHNLNEDELAGFEEAWEGNARKHLPGLRDGHGVMGSGSSAQAGPNRTGGWALPSVERPHHSGGARPDMRETAGPSRSQKAGNMQGDGAGLSRARSRAGGKGNAYQPRRH